MFSYCASFFIIFPVAGAVWGIPAFPLDVDSAILLRHYAVLLSNHPPYQFSFLVVLGGLHLLWFCLVKWRVLQFYFYLSNLLIYELDEIFPLNPGVLTFVLAACYCDN